MADITLAEFRGEAWLISGEDWLDELLSNKLPDGKTIEIIPCAVKSDVHEMWLQASPQAAEDEANGISGMPWQIHPKILARIKRSAVGFVVQFTAWSAMIDADSERVIASAAYELREKPGIDATIVCYDEADAGPALAAISEVRMQMVSDRLVAADVALTRIRRERRDKGTATDGPVVDRVDIVLAGS